MNRYPDDPRDDIFTITKRSVRKNGHEYICELEERIRSVTDVLEVYRDENTRLRSAVGELRGRTCERAGWDKQYQKDLRRNGFQWAPRQIEGPRTKRFVMGREHEGDDDYERLSEDCRREGRCARSNIGVKREAKQYSTQSAILNEDYGERGRPWNWDWDFEDDGYRRQEEDTWNGHGRSRGKYGTKIREHEQRKTRQPQPRSRLDFRTRPVSNNEETVRQVRCELPSPTSRERSRSLSDPWERRDTMDGLYYYFINLNNGRMTDIHSIPREGSDEDDFHGSRRRNPLPPRSTNKDSRRPDTHCAPLPQPAVFPHSNRNLQTLRPSDRPLQHALESASTNGSKNSRLSLEVFPASSRSHEYSPAAKLDLCKSVFKAADTEPQLLSLRLLPSYHTQNSHRQRFDHNPITPALTTASPNRSSTPRQSKSISESFPSYEDYALATGRRHSNGNQQWSFLDQQPNTNYQLPFVNTISDVEDKERKGRNFGKVFGLDDA